MNYRNEKNDELHYNEVCRTYRLFLDGGGDIGSRENREYDAAVADAIEYFGGEENAPVWADMDTAEVFANVYKSDMGFRPRGWMLAAARAWLDARPEYGYGNEGMTADDMRQQAADDDAEMQRLEDESRAAHMAWGKAQDALAAEKLNTLPTVADQPHVVIRERGKSWLYDLI
jgi:hypothetical protein